MSTKDYLLNKVLINNKKEFEENFFYDRIIEEDYPKKYPCFMKHTFPYGGNVVVHEITYEEETKYSYQGYHATADIILNEYPKNIVDIFRNSIKYSKLNVVSELVHDFGGAVTAVFVLSESHATLHEYPESNYVTVDIYTCGKEGDPKAAIMNFINELDVKEYKFNFINRGEF